MILAVASGKGGTGKTLLATGLAWTLGAKAGLPVTLIDCDVEEPNAHLFLRPQFTWQKQVFLPVPQVLPDRCTLCGRCAEVCAFRAIAVTKQKVLIFPHLCHACGSCVKRCPERAIAEKPLPLGMIRGGQAEGALGFADGQIEIGQAMATPLIKELKRQALRPTDTSAIVILDSPPGTACPVIETLRGSHFALLVTEPTPLGLHDLQLATEVAREELGLPVGVVINRDGLGDSGVAEYCAQADIPVLLRLPFDRAIAEACANGQLWVKVLPQYQQSMLELYRRALEVIREQYEATCRA